MIGIRNLLLPLCCACGMVLAGYHISQKITTPESVSTRHVAVATKAKGLADLPSPSHDSGDGDPSPHISRGDSRPEKQEPGVERAEGGLRSAINIGENLNPDEPYLANEESHALIDLGPPLDVNPSAYQHTQGESRDLGVPINVDCLDCASAGGATEYRNIGRELSVDEYYQADESNGGAPRNIGPDIDIESYLAGQ